MKQLRLGIFVLIFFSLFIYKPSISYAEEKINFWRLVTDLPKTAQDSITTSFTRDTIVPWSSILLSTGLLYHYDPEILQNVQHFGVKQGIGNDDHTKTVVHLGSTPLLRLPSDTGSTLYFLGDGWVHMSAALAFAATGYFTENARPWNTGLEMVHGMIVSTVFSQGLKRASGRESPTNRSEPRGRWRPFESIDSYNTQTAKYDAFPSGHIMTATLAFTVINENYPEYSNYIVPFAGVWLTALGFQMVNNGVHWASDYPLGIAMGYHIGRVVSRMGKDEGKAVGGLPKTKYMVVPNLDPRSPGLFLQAAF